MKRTTRSINAYVDTVRAVPEAALTMLAGSVVLLAAAPPAWGASAIDVDGIQLTATAEPQLITHPFTRELAFRLTVTNTGVERQFGLRLDVPHFERRAAGARRLEGSSIAPAGPVQSDGPATVTQTGIVHLVMPCSPSSNRPHGYEPIEPIFAVTAPANSTSTLTATYETGEQAPWPGTDYRLSFLISPTRGIPATQAVSRSATVAPSRFSLRGATGRRITLSTTPQSSPEIGMRMRRVRPGTRVLIRGTTDPKLRRGLVTLKHLVPGSRKLQVLARVRTRSDGRFVWRKWRPSRRGIHELWAFTPAKPPRVAADYTCPLGLRVR